MSLASFGLLPEDISIVTAVYNHESTVSEAIESVLMQKTKHRFHLYCINDASTDNSGSILQAYQARYARL